MSKIERRYNPLTVECRAENGNRISGYASVFYDGTPATEYRIMKNAVERVMPTAFDSAIQEQQDVRALFNHDNNYVLGRTKSNTLKLSIDNRGLNYEIEPSESSIYKDLLISINRGDVTGSSIGFNVAADGSVWKREGDTDVREIHTFETIVDVSPVTFPAFEGTTAGVRSDKDISETAIKSYMEYRKGIFSKLIRARMIEIGLT